MDIRQLIIKRLTGEGCNDYVYRQVVRSQVGRTSIRIRTRDDAMRMLDAGADRRTSPWPAAESEYVSWLEKLDDGALLDAYTRMNEHNG